MGCALALSYVLSIHNIFVYVYRQDSQNIHNYFVYIIHIIIEYVLILYNTISYQRRKERILIKYKIDVLQALKEKGYSTYKIRKYKVFNEAQLQQIRDDKLVTQDTLNKLCMLLDCQPGDILEYVPDTEE